MTGPKRLKQLVQGGQPWTASEQLWSWPECSEWTNDLQMSSNTGNLYIQLTCTCIKRDVFMSKMANLSHEKQNGSTDSPYSDLFKSNCLLQNSAWGGMTFVWLIY